MLLSRAMDVQIFLLVHNIPRQHPNGHSLAKIEKVDQSHCILRYDTLLFT